MPNCGMRNLIESPFTEQLISSNTKRIRNCFYFDVCRDSLLPFKLRETTGIHVNSA